MTTFDAYSREHLRRAYLDAWRKHNEKTLLTPLESLLADVIGAHPEYQRQLERPDAVEMVAGPDPAQENPFLHLGLHVAVREQLAVDRPPGIRALHGRLIAQHGDVHRAEHVLMESLAETLWEAQRSGRPPDEARYLDLARGRTPGSDAT